MKASELRNLICEEVRKVISEAGEGDLAKKVLKKKEFVRITPATKLKVGDDVLGMYNDLFGTIVKVSGDNYFITYDIDYADEKPTKRSRKQMEDSFILDARKKK